MAVTRLSATIETAVFEGITASFGRMGGAGGSIFVVDEDVAVGEGTSTLDTA